MKRNALELWQNLIQYYKYLKSDQGVILTTWENPRFVSYLTKNVTTARI